MAEEIKYSRDFHESMTIPAGGVETDVVNDIWRGQNGFIVGLGFGIQDPAQWANAYFSLWIDTMRVPDWGFIRDQVGRFDDPTPVRIAIAPGSRFRITAVNNNLVDALMAARMILVET